MRTTVAAVLLLSMSLITGCSTPKIMGDGITDLTLEISVANDANPDDNNRPSPVFLRVVELRDAGGFRNASYIDLYRDAQGELGGAYLNSNDIGPLFPGSGRTEELRLNSAAAAVGIMGEFNRYDEMVTTVVVEFEPGKDAKAKIRVDGSGIHID